MGLEPAQLGDLGVQLEVCERVQGVIDPFVPHDKLDGFTRMLDATGAAAVGSTVRRLLASGSDYMRDRLQRGYRHQTESCPAITKY